MGAVANIAVAISHTHCFTMGLTIRRTHIATHAAMLRFLARGTKVFRQGRHFALTGLSQRPPNHGSSRVRVADHLRPMRRLAARIATDSFLLSRREPGSSKMQRAQPKIGDGKGLGLASTASSSSIRPLRTTGAMLLPNLSLNPDASPAALRAVRSAPVSLVRWASRRNATRIRVSSLI
jgi:hypothetical protein